MQISLLQVSYQSSSNPKPSFVKLTKLISITAVAAVTLSSSAVAQTPATTESETTSLAVYLLHQLNEREQLAYEKFESAVTEEDVDQVRRELQSVVDGYERLVADSPNFAPLYVSYGLMLNRTGNRDEANAMFLKADQLDPMLPVVKNQLGNYMAEEGKYAEAYGFYMLARDLDPKQSLYPYQIGNLLVAYRKFFIADELFNGPEIDAQILSTFKAAAKNAEKGDISYKMRYAQAFFDVDNPNWELALELWQELYSAAGSEYEQQIVHLYIARVRFELGHHQAARKLLNKIDHPSLDESKQTLLNSIEEKYPQ